MYKRYKLSGWATFVSGMGAACQWTGVGCLFAELFLAGIICLCIGIALYCAGENINFKKWVKLIQSKGLEEQIRTNVEVAIQIYNKYPGDKTLNYISKLNPQAGQQISAAQSKK